MIEFIAWPTSALLGFVFLLLLFRAPITSLIHRVRSIKKDGIETIDTPSQAKSEALDGGLMKHFDTPLLVQIEDNIRETLREKHLDLSTPTAKVLIRHLAHAQMTAGFESTYRRIYGSQIRILKESNTPTGVSIVSTKAFFRQLSEEHGDFYADFPFCNYIQFLFNEFLILEKSGAYHATIRGQAFLEWIVRNQLSEHRAF